MVEKDNMKLILLVTVSMLMAGCFIGASMPHGQKPGLIIGVNMGVK